VAGSCEHGNEHSSSIKGRTFLDKVSEYQLLRKDPFAWSWFVQLIAFLISVQIW
jgi:hypothetical protein